MTEDPAELRPFELAYPGPVRDALVAAVLSGAKTSTSSLLAEYDDDGDPIPAVGDLGALVDSNSQPVAVVETTELRTVPLGEIDLDFARDEGEGYASVASWREAHERYWRMWTPDIKLDDSTVVVAERFRVVGLLDAPDQR